MVSVERASKCEQTLLKYYSLKINHLQDREGKKLSNQLCQFLFSYDYKKYSPNYFYRHFFILFLHFTFFDKKIDIFQALRRRVLLFDRALITS